MVLLSTQIVYRMIVSAIPINSISISLTRTTKAMYLPGHLLKEKRVPMGMNKDFQLCQGACSATDFYETPYAGRLQ